MATLSSNRSPAEITIPADYLEDVRSALVSGINNDSDALRSDHQEVLDGLAAGREDRAGAVRILRASGDTTIRGDWSALVHVLEATVSVLSGRLADTGQYAPLPDLDVLDLSYRLQWAAHEIGRIGHDGAVA
jgi:hypothetical protein